ncbi:MAG: ABC-type branched-chain amino acid transport system, periplasmic component [uncultured bacterium]|uniref:Leucine-binding protein domain-containing protein n=1 Tax=Candidatus Wallbacteria bacterium GWC2_49_35 TaxID=1817813 RepID=A0A1F7WM99_9BACT|nr:MAG: ABC-type branched-chain amino acid transport system, periplasmic component [uncultured bacterium]OGM03677.1 MAG: hypothetical protein A2008_08445 [Candidatus Wallbacteria bacterium GWC2_49_35]
MIKKYCFIIILTLSALILSGCFLKKSEAERRAERARASRGEISVGVAWPISAARDRFVEGVNLACDEINGSGGVLGRKIKLVIKDTEGSALNELKIVHELVEDPDILAFIGHRNSSSAAHAASMFQKYGILSMFTGVTSGSLTGRGRSLVFRNTGCEATMGARLAELASQKNYKKIAMIYTYTEHGRNLANAFEKRCDDYEINIVDRRGYFKDNDKFFDDILNTWQSLDFDAVCLIGDLPQIGTFIVKMRGCGIKTPIISSDGLASFDLKDCAGDSADGAVIVTPFHISDRNGPADEFMRGMKKKFNVDRVDQYSALGYDGLRFLAYAMNEAKSVVPAEVAAKIHSGLSWPGATGVQKFNSRGDIIDKEYDIVTFINGGFKFLQH